MKNALKYLADLSANNNREWHHTHRDEYKAANAEFEQLVEELNNAVSGFDDAIAHFAPKELTFKMMRDTRFSHDKSPYNPKFRAHISAAGKLPIPVGYFIAIAPGKSFLGGGLFADMFKDATTMIRRYIVAHGDEFEAVVSDKDFTTYYSVMGEVLKNVPRGYDADHPQSEYLKFKSFYTQFDVPDSVVLDGNFVNKATMILKAAKPLNDFLNKALAGFQMPTR